MRVASFLLALILLAPLAACDTESTSLYDPDRTSAPDPVISEVVTDGPVTLAGIDAITIRGQNFSSEPGQTIVYFEDSEGTALRGVVVSATATELRVLTPNFPSDDLTVRVSVIGAENFSAPMPVVLSPAIQLFGSIVTGEREEVRAMTQGLNGDLIASLAQNNSDTGVFRFDEETGERTLISGTIRTWADLAVPSDGQLYGVDNRRVVWQIPEAGAPVQFGRDDALPQPVFATLLAGPDGELWAANSGPQEGQTRIYRFAPDGTFVVSAPAVADSSFSGVPRDLALYDGHLYVASDAAASSRIWRFPILPDGTLGAGEVVFLAPPRPGSELPPNVTHAVSALAFAADGTLFIGTNALVDPVYELQPGGTAEILYPGVVTGPVRDFAWGSGTALYYATPPLLGPSGGTAAAAQLYTLETRRQGAF